MVILANKKKDVKNEIWNKFCEKLKQIFKGKFCVYLSQEDVNELKSIDDPAGLLEENYYSLVEPTTWKLKITENNEVSFEPKVVKSNKASWCLNSKLRKFIKNNKSELTPTGSSEWNTKDSELMYSVNNPKLIESGLKKVKDKIQSMSEKYEKTSEQSSTKTKKILSKATELYESLKKLESHAKILKHSLGDSKEDNDYVIERERPRNFLWRFLGRLGGTEKSNYQEISDDNGSKEFTLNSLFERSKIYRKMLKAYMDYSPENVSIKLEQSLIRKSLRILIALKKWFELYTKKPTAINARGKLGELLTTEVNKFLKFSGPKKTAKEYKDLDGNKIDQTSLVNNIGNIYTFLKKWSKLKLTTKYAHKIKNITVKDVALTAYNIAKELNASLNPEPTVVKIINSN